MAKERLKSPRARLFVALDLPGTVRDGIVEWGKAALEDDALRPIGAESLHITLAFLGFLLEKEIPRLARVVEMSDGSAPSIELHDPIPIPSRGQPRAFALPIESPSAISLQAALQERLVAEGLYEPEKRPFWPHITVARVRRKERGSKRPAHVTRPPGMLPKKLLRPFDGVRMTLYRSKLQPRGAQYTPLAQAELPVRGRQ